MKSIKLFRIVKQSVTFYEDDFNSIEEFDKFVLKLKTNEELINHTFHENMEDDEVINDIEIKIEE